jgi:hypothetical protein
MVNVILKETVTWTMTISVDTDSYETYKGVYDGLPNDTIQWNKLKGYFNSRVTLWTRLDTIGSDNRFQLHSIVM